MTLLDRQDIADLLKVDLRQFRERIEKMPGFPQPKVRISRKMVRWDQTDINRWIERKAA